MSSYSNLWGCKLDDAKFQANVRRLAPMMKEEAQNEIDKAASRFERHLTRNVPKDSGDLQSTIERRDTSSGDRFQATVTIGSDQNEYAAPLEFGHILNGKRIPPQRFFFPLASIYNKRFKNALRRAARRVAKKFNT